MKKLSIAGRPRADMVPGSATSGDSQFDDDLLWRLRAALRCFEPPATPSGHCSRIPYPRHLTPLCVHMPQPGEGRNSRTLVSFMNHVNVPMRNSGGKDVRGRVPSHCLFLSRHVQHTPLSFCRSVWGRFNSIVCTIIELRLDASTKAHWVLRFLVAAAASSATSKAGKMLLFW